MSAARITKTEALDAIDNAEEDVRQWFGKVLDVGEAIVRDELKKLPKENATGPDILHRADLMRKMELCVALRVLVVEHRARRRRGVR